MPDLERLRWVAEAKFLALVRSTTMVRDKLRVVLNDGSYIDFWWSTQIPGRYAYHWERRHVDGTIYRHDNMPHPQWQGIQSFPKHFHAGDQDTVLESTLTADPEQALREFLLFAARKIAEEGR
jgi:Family of unknown function (DUF6516)